MISLGRVACFVKIVFAGFLYPYVFPPFYPFKPLGQFIIFWVVFYFGFALLLSRLS